MLRDKLRYILEDINFDIKLFFKSDMGFDSRDLLELPPKYLKKIEAFISTHSREELDDLEPIELIEQATGESYDKIVKLINVAKKVQSLEQDFI